MATELAKAGTTPATQQPQGNVSTPSMMVLGKITPDLAEIEELVSLRRKQVHRSANVLQDDQARVELLAEHDLLTFDHYRAACRIADRWKRDLAGSFVLKEEEDTPAVRGILSRFNGTRYTADVAGWQRYLADRAPQMGALIEQLGASALLPAETHEMHALITAAPKWGKTELIKAMVHHYVEHQTAAVVLIDPHGDMAEQVAMWPEFHGSDRLVYVEPELEPGRTVGLNPFDTSGLEPHEIAKYADELGTAISEISSQLTPHMETVARGSVRLLLEDGGATLFDLFDLLETPPKRGENPSPFAKNRARLIAKGRAHSDGAMQRYFYGGAESDSYKSSREGVNKRVMSMLMLPEFQDLTCGRSTIDLPALIDQRKVIVFNLVKFGTSGAAALGRMLIALLAAMAKRRSKIARESRVPCHVFIDEAHTLASPSMARILFECRKFGLFLTLAQQAEKVGHDDVGQQALANAISVKMAGSNRKAPLAGVFEDRPVPDGEPLKRHEFWTKWGDAKPVRLSVKSNLVAPAPDRASPEWRAMVASQSEHYREAKERLPAPALLAASDAVPASAPPPARDEYPLI